MYLHRGGLATTASFPDTPRMHHFLFIAICLIWGTRFVLMDRASLAFGPFTIGAAGTIGGAALLRIVWTWQHLACPVRRRDVPMLLLIVLVGYAHPFAVQPYLISKIGHGYIGTIVCLVPLFTIVISIPLLRQYPSRVQLVGVLLGLGFMVIYFSDGLDRHVPVGLLLLAASVPTGYAFANCLVKRYMGHLPATPLACIGLSLAGVILLPAALALERPKPTPSFHIAVGALVFLALLSRGTATAFFYALIHKRGPLFAGMVSYIIPLVVLTWSWLDSEHISVKQIVSAAGALLTVGIVQLDIERRAAATSRDGTEGAE